MDTGMLLDGMTYVMGAFERREVEFNAVGSDVVAGIRRS